MTYRLLVSALFLAVSLTASSPIYACSCSGTISMEDHLRDRELIFAGVVTSIEPVADSAWDNLVTFEVTTYWKGEEVQTVSIITANNSAACGYEFAMGLKYLVFADDYGVETEHLFTNLCLGNTDYDDADIKMDELTALTPIEHKSWSDIKALFGPGE